MAGIALENIIKYSGHVNHGNGRHGTAYFSVKELKEIENKEYSETYGNVIDSELIKTDSGFTAKITRSKKPKPSFFSFLQTDVKTTTTYKLKEEPLPIKLIWRDNTGPGFDRKKSRVITLDVLQIHQYRPREIEELRWFDTSILKLEVQLDTRKVIIKKGADVKAEINYDDIDNFEIEGICEKIIFLEMKDGRRIYHEIPALEEFCSNYSLELINTEHLSHAFTMD